MAVARFARADGPPLPPVCAITGRPAELVHRLRAYDTAHGRTRRRYRFSWDFPLTRSARRRQMILRTLQNLGAFPLLGGLIAIAAGFDDKHTFAGHEAQLRVGGGIALGVALLLLVLARPPLRMTITDDARYIVIKGAHPAYVLAASSPQFRPAQTWGAQPPVPDDFGRFMRFNLVGASILLAVIGVILVMAAVLVATS